MYIQKPSELIEVYDEYEVLWEQREYYGALLRLSEIHSSLKSFSSNDKAEWLDKISISDISNSIKQDVFNRIEDEIHKLHKIISIGDDFTYEEIVLVITIRNDLEMLITFLGDNNIDISQINLSIVDEELKELLSINKYKVIFDKAFSQISKNRGKNIFPVWFNEIA